MDSKEALQIIDAVCGAHLCDRNTRSQIETALQVIKLKILAMEQSAGAKKEKKKDGKGKD